MLHERHQKYIMAKKELATFKPPASFHRDCTVCSKDACGKWPFKVPLSKEMF